MVRIVTVALLVLALGAFVFPVGERPQEPMYVLIQNVGDTTMMAVCKRETPCPPNNRHAEVVWKMPRVEGCDWMFYLAGRKRIEWNAWAVAEGWTDEGCQSLYEGLFPVIMPRPVPSNTVGP